MAKNWVCLDCGKLIWNRFLYCKSCSHKGNRNAWFGKGSRPQHSGEGNPNWHGGISKTGYTLEFRKVVRKLVVTQRPVCQICKKREDLVAHHIDFDKLNNGLENLITLCRSCNARVNFHRRYHTYILTYKMQKSMFYV